MVPEVTLQVLDIIGVDNLEPRTFNYLKELEDLQKPSVANIVTRHLGQTEFGQSKVVNVYFTKEQIEKFGKLEIIQLTDMQYGNKACKIPSVKKFVKFILDKPNRFVLMTGDNVDAATVKSPGSPWDNWFEPQSQVYAFCKLMAPIRHRVLGYVGGNHERRGIPAFGDLGFLIATLLKLPYSKGQQIVNIHFGKHSPFRAHLWHGLPRAGTKGTLAQILDRFMQKGDARLYLTGHNHQGLILPFWKQYSDEDSIRLKGIIGAQGTSFLEFWGTYAEVMGLNASDVFMPRTVLYPNGSWDVTVHMES